MTAVLEATREIPRDFVEIYDAIAAAGWSEWTESVQAVQDDVDTFVKLFRDRNKIHARDSVKPIVPGIFTFASLTRYLEQQPDIVSFPGHVTVIEVFKELRFMSFVPVGSRLAMRYRLTGLGSDTVGIYVDVDFEIRANGKTRNAVQSSMRLRFISHRIYELLIARA